MRQKKVDFSEMGAFGVSEMRTFPLEMHSFHFEMHRTGDFHSNLLVSWELVTEGYEGRPMT